MSIQEKVHHFKTTYKEGFVQVEIDMLLKEFPEINIKRFKEALKCITVMEINGETIFYRHDIIKALRCGIENRNLKPEEWD